MKVSGFVLGLCAALSCLVSPVRSDDPPPFPCPGCDSGTSSQYVQVPCPDGGFAFIRVDVYSGDGWCELWGAPPYADYVCRPWSDCHQWVVSQIGSTDPVFGTMTYTHGEYKDTPCGRTKNLNFSGSCGVSLSVSLVCSSCQNIGSEGG